MENNKRDKDIFYRAILQAEKNGYKEHLNFLPVFISKTARLEDLAKAIFIKHKNEIIYSHTFAKAFFGEEDQVYSRNAWVNHLKEMSRTPNEIDYLESFLDV